MLIEMVQQDCFYKQLLPSTIHPPTFIPKPTQFHFFPETLFYLQQFVPYSYSPKWSTFYLNKSLQHSRFHNLGYDQGLVLLRCQYKCKIYGSGQIHHQNSGYSKKKKKRDKQYMNDFFYLPKEN